MISKPNIVFRENLGHFLEIDVVAIPDWAGFDKIVQFLKNEYSVEVVDAFDGADARRWRLKTLGQEFDLVHEDPYGNSILALNKESEDVVRAIGSDLRARLEGL